MHHKRRSRRADSRYDIGWDATSRERKLPIEDGPCAGRKTSKRTRPKKEKCPVNRTHEWYVERITAHHSWAFQSYTHEWDTVEDVYTCIHCWKVKKKHVRQPSSWRESPKRKLRLPKRPVSMC